MTTDYELPAKPSYLAPEGDHLARARAWVWEETKNHDPMLVIDFAGELDPNRDASQDAAEPTMGDRSVWHRIAFTANMTDKAKEQKAKEIRAMGFAGDDLSTIGDNTGGLDANVVRVTIEHELYNGKWQEKIAFVNALRDNSTSRLTARNPPSKGALQALSAQMKGLFRVGASNGAQSANKPANGQQGASAGPRTGQSAQSNQRPAARPTPAPAPAPANGQRGPNPWDLDPGMGYDADVPF